MCGCKPCVYIDIWPCVCAWWCMELVLNFMLYFSCGYDGIHVENESRMNLMEVGKIRCWPCGMERKMEMN